jgi:Fe-S-cluster-containing hydrogenase component 2
MQAIRYDGARAVAIDERKCIGCGLCVATCQSGALSLVPKEKAFVPPKDIEELYQVIDEHKKSTVGKYAMMIKALFGREV